MQAVTAWNGLDANGQPLADGAYAVVVEGTYIRTDADGGDETPIQNGATGDVAVSGGVTLDATPPQVEHDYLFSGAWRNLAANITLMATDNLSGVAHVYYRLGAADPAEGTQFIVDAEGVTAVEYWAVDAAGNESAHGTIEVKLDFTPPATTHDYALDGQWTNQDASITLTASDDGSGVSDTFYRIDGADAMTGTQISITDEGDHTVEFWSVDNAGNEGQRQSISVKIDKTAPVLVASLSPESNANGWNNTDVTVSFEATDALSGVDTSSAPQTVTQEGVTEVTGFATDRAGNIAVSYVSVAIDKTAPVLVAAADPAPNAAGWNNADVTVTFSATDALSGVDAVSNPVIVTTEAADQQATGSAVDKAGNTAETTATVNLDKTAPVTTHDYAYYGVPIDREAVINFLATDAVSGVADTYYTVDGGQPVAATQLTLSAPGEYAVAFWSADNAGNVETAGSISVRIRSGDTLPPITTHDYPSDGVWVADNVTITFAALDNEGGSGVAATYASVNGGAPNAVTYLNFTGEGEFVVQYWSVDNAGNTESPQTVTVRIDSTAPSLTLQPADGETVTTSSFGVSATWTDGGAGVGGATPLLFLDGADVTASATITPTGLTYSTGVLPDGFHTVTLTVVDGAGNVANAASAVAVQTPTGDFDGDGLSNEYEALIGTDPRDAGSGTGTGQASVSLDSASTGYRSALVTVPDGTPVEGDALPNPAGFVRGGVENTIFHPWYYVTRDDQQHEDEAYAVQVFGNWVNPTIHGTAAAGTATFEFAPSDLLSTVNEARLWPVGDAFDSLWMTSGPFWVEDFGLGAIQGSKWILSDPPQWQSASYTNVTQTGYYSHLEYGLTSLKTNLDMTISGGSNPTPSPSQKAPASIDALQPGQSVGVGLSLSGRIPFGEDTTDLNGNGRIDILDRTVTLTSSNPAAIKFRNVSSGGQLSNSDGTVTWTIRFTEGGTVPSMSAEAFCPTDSAGGSGTIEASIGDATGPGCLARFFGDAPGVASALASDGTHAGSVSAQQADGNGVARVDAKGSSEATQLAQAPPRVTITRCTVVAFVDRNRFPPVLTVQVITQGTLSPSAHAVPNSTVMVAPAFTLANGIPPLIGPAPPAPRVVIDPDNGTSFFAVEYFEWLDLATALGATSTTVTVTYTTPPALPGGPVLPPATARVTLTTIPLLRNRLVEPDEQLP